MADGAVQGEKISSIEANKPVLLKNEGTLELTSTTVAAPESMVNGLLTGVYDSKAIPEGSYVLQKQNEEVAFFRVGATQPTVVPFRAYLTVPNNQACLTQMQIVATCFRVAVVAHGATYGLVKTKRIVIFHQ